MDKNELKKNVLKRFIIFMIIWWIVIFLPAWDLKYWPGWIYWFVYLIMLTAGNTYFMKTDPELISRRLRAGPAAEKERGQKIIQSLAGFVLLLMIVFSGIDYRMGWSNVPAAAVIAANVLVGVCFIVIYRVFKENSYASSIIEKGEEQKVISTGPYAVVRHPMYSAAVPFFLLSPIALGSYYGVIFAFTVCLTVAARLLNEEKFLLKNLPGYAEYAQKVRWRLIPYIW